MEDLVDVLTFAGIIGTMIVMWLYGKYSQHRIIQITELRKIDQHIMAAESGWVYLEDDQPFTRKLFDHQLNLATNPSFNWIYHREILQHQVWLFTCVIRMTSGREQKDLGYVSTLVEFEGCHFTHLAILSDEILQWLPVGRLGKPVKFQDETGALDSVSCFSRELNPVHQMEVIEKLKPLIDHHFFAGLVANGQYVVLYYLGELPDSEADFSEANYRLQRIIRTFSEPPENNEQDLEIERLKREEQSSADN